MPPRREPFMRSNSAPQPPPAPYNYPPEPRRPSDGFIDEYAYNTYKAARLYVPIAIVVGIIGLVCILVWFSKACHTNGVCF